ncbi:zinc finger protein 501-like [Anopheles aquasalis]|uniref:zinc finger protein 501-like n=1 Tax=Anopheles aquasalis TaxID=42839 RepID=UPI00215B5BC8|nr:zinc finger protein 501-like [Anopheles aquasalis]
MEDGQTTATSVALRPHPCCLCGGTCLETSTCLSETVAERILLCTGVKLRNPDVESVLCAACISQLASCERFIERCRVAESRLLELYEQNKVAERQPIKLVLDNATEQQPTAGDAVDEALDLDEPTELGLTEVDTQRARNAKCSRKSSIPKSQCQICGAMQQNLKQHMMVHTGERAHVCPYCQKAFSQKGNLNHHINQHTGHRPYACDQCDKSYPDPQSLRSHKLLHSMERPYSCDVCHATFKYKHSLTMHARRHTEEKPFSCQECNRTFITSSALKKHTRRHSQERTHRCEECTKTFKSSSNLRVHRLSHTKQPRFQCSLCDSWFSYKSVLKTHMNVHTRTQGKGCKVANKCPKL